MNIETLRSQLKKLKLSSAALELEDVLAVHKQAVSLDWVSELLEREIDVRKGKAIERRISNAGFPEVTTLESFDWKFNPKVDRIAIEELAKLEFVRENRIALFLGPTGVGKTHLGLAIGVLAARQGYRVWCTSTKKLIQQLTLAKARNSLDAFFKKALSSQLWIIDDWGVVSMNREVAEEVFDLLDRRRYSSAMILTSNRDITEWGQVFPEPVLANATIDRIFDRATILVFEGKSYRLKGAIKMPSLDFEQAARTMIAGKGRKNKLTEKQLTN